MRRSCIVTDFKGMQKTAGKYGVYGRPRNVSPYHAHHLVHCKTYLYTVKHTCRYSVLGLKQKKIKV